MRWIRWIAAAAGVVAVLIVAAVAYVATLDLNAYKGDLEAALQSATGRRVAIDGPLHLEWTPGPGLTATGLRVANAEWGSAADMATVGDLDVKVALLPLISGRVEVKRLVLSDVRLLLERGADGAGNWQIGDASSGNAPSGGAAGPAPEIREAALNDVTVVWKPGPKAAGRTYRVESLSVEPAAAGGLAVALKAEVDGDLLDLSGVLPSPAGLARQGEALPVDVEGALGGRPFTVKTTLRARSGGIGAEGLALSFGDMAIEGDLAVGLSGGRPTVEGSLRTGTVDLAAGGAGGAGNPLDAPLPYELLALADGKLDLAVDRLVAAGIAVENLKATADLAGGVLTLDPVTATVADGSLKGRAEIDGSQAPGRLAVAAAAGGVDMAAVYRALMGEALVEGRGDALLDLSGSGATPRALLGASRGVARLVVRDGVIRNRYWELIAEDLATRFLPFVEDADRGRLNCMVGRFDIAKGIADASVLMVDSDKVTVAGEGTVDLAAQTLDMRLVPRPKDPSLFSLATPILLTGPLADPRPAPDPVAVAKGLGSIAASTALGPVGLLLPFVSSGSADQPCPEAIAAAEGKRPPAAKRSSTEQDKPGGIKGLFEGLRKAIE